MTLEAYLEKVRAFYVERLRGFIERQKGAVTLGGPEVKFELSGTDAVFRRLYCADFVKNDGGHTEIVEYQPDRRLDLAPLNTEFGFMDVQVEGFSWDKFVIEWSPDALTADGLNEWFEMWFDPAGRRRDRDAEFAECIHCVVLTEASLTIDLGTAPVEAVLALLEVMEQEGCERVRISG